MKKSRTPSGVALMLWIAMSFFSPVSADLAGKYQEKLIEYLEMGPANALKLDAHDIKVADIDSKLFDLYKENGLQLYWIRDGKADVRATDIRNILITSDRHGLNPNDYFVKDIDQLWNSTRTEDVVRLDIFLSLGMMRYVADQREGRITPRRLDPKLFATARNATVDWNSLWNTAFKTPNMKVFLTDQTPPFHQYQALVKELQRYRTISAAGGWPSLPKGTPLKLDMVDHRIEILRKRLIISEDMAPENVANTTFDVPLEKGVKAFQRRHNLAADGVVGKKTLAALNISVEHRIQQIIINMERYRWLTRSIMDGRLVAVNIAGFEAYAGKPGHAEIKTPVIVGKKYHKTPVFNDTIKYVVFNPYWNVPSSIARNEMLPSLKKDPYHLTRHHIRLFDGWGPDAKELDPTTIEWNEVTRQAMNRYHLRQDPGSDNALGTLKLVFPNKYNVYMHDTPSRSLFKKETRTFSHGCIRMDKPREMASWVLGGKENGWGMKKIDKIIASRKRQVVVLEEPVPIYILYRTAFVNLDDGVLYFYDDVYGRDKLLIKALFDQQT